MNADTYILQLPHVLLKSKELLPEDSGIYYVIDENELIWYIGKAKNIKTRWSGKTHHRILQLGSQKGKVFHIYFEIISPDQLTKVEKARIEQYKPQLNGSKVKTKTIRPAETLLRETLNALSEYIIIIGIEPPRKDDPVYIEKCNKFGNNWRILKKVLPLPIIHLCIDLTNIYQNSENYRAVNLAIDKAFSSRKAYSHQWESRKTESTSIRLLVNGYAVEVYDISKEAIALITGYEFTTLAGVPVRVINSESLQAIKKYCGQSTYSIFNLNDDSEVSQFHNHPLKRLLSYKQDPIKILFNESINSRSIDDNIKQFEEEYKSQKRGFDSRSNQTKYDISDILVQRGIDLKCYSTHPYVKDYSNKRIYLYIKSFSTNLYEPTGQKNYISENGEKFIISLPNFIKGSQGAFSQGSDLNLFPYQNVYMLTSVEREAWLLFEHYLSDFAKVTLSEDDGYISRVYVSAKKCIKPAQVKISLGNQRTFIIPFGPSETIVKYDQVRKTMIESLKNSGLPDLKISFSSESVSQCRSVVTFSSLHPLSSETISDLLKF
ncbi:GIY-YIG nuclease family protein [Planktothrix mougeotii]|uniref:GIY-YIG nuclease family protein n=1 Tax=Planktothrix mougeotii LEGE 06226 TaxID=1828728 RepID=A0ABR9UF98_9CYAN|nr:GIY-YIG nuclease family protein [Planktothrix mougeotii]MBE9145123.1 GIY-YIG nuclease family protein [Planktothrix mougeotii LEGE 06226]